MLCIPCDFMASASAPARVWLLEVSVSDNVQNMQAYELNNGYKYITMTGNNRGYLFS